MQRISQHNASRHRCCAGCSGLLTLLLLAGCSSASRPAGEAEAKLSVSELTDRLKSDDVQKRLGAVHGLRRHGSDAAPALSELLRLLKHDSEISIRQGAAQALGEIGPAAASAVPELIRVMLNETDAPLRRQAAAALGKLGAAAKPALPALRQILQSGPPIVKQAAEESVKKIEGK
jgi:HEAT repeat protein